MNDIPDMESIEEDEIDMRNYQQNAPPPVNQYQNRPPPPVDNGSKFRVQLCCFCGCLAAVIAAIGVTLMYTVFEPTTTSSVPGSAEDTDDLYLIVPTDGSTGRFPTASPTGGMPSSAPTNKNTLAPVSLAPTTSLKPSGGPRYRDIRTKILGAMSSLTFGNIEAFSDDTSPQSQALNWLVYEDPAKLDPSSIDLVQRFLVANLWYNMGGLLWKSVSLWKTSASECDWFGISCNSGTLRVQRIVLEDNNLVGTIPLEIGGFSSLTNLRLGNNLIAGTIPLTIGNLMGLNNIELWTNGLIGPIPTSIGMLGSLNSIYFDSNQLTGPIPSQIGNLYNLVDLSLFENKLKSPLPPQMSKLVKLRRIWISNNAFTGAFPTLLYSMQSLQAMYLDINQFSGTIPEEFATSLPGVQDLRLSSNRFIGCPPKNLFTMASLKILYIDENLLSCDLFPEIYAGPVMTDLQMFRNPFGGPLPEVTVDSSTLEVLHLAEADLSGSIPNSYGKLTKLEKLYLGRNKLYGTIPFDMISLTSLEKLQLNDNKLQGTIPNYFGSYTLMKTLHMHGNIFTGTVNTRFGNLLSLESFKVEGNSLVGTMPTEVCNLFSVADPQLTELTADCSGTIPELECACCTFCAFTPPRRLAGTP